MIWGFLLAIHIIGAVAFLYICWNDDGGISLGEILLACVSGITVPFVLLFLYWPTQNPFTIKIIKKRKDSDQ